MRVLNVEDSKLRRANVTQPSAGIVSGSDSDLTDREAIMERSEIQARAIIAAALIARGAVEVPSIPPGGQRAPDPAGVRLRELTDYVYRLLATDEPHDSE